MWNITSQHQKACVEKLFEMGGWMAFFPLDRLGLNKTFDFVPSVGIEPTAAWLNATYHQVAMSYKTRNHTNLFL